MKRGTLRIITILFVLIFLFAIPASAGLLTDVANRFSLGSMSMITGFGIFNIFGLTGNAVGDHETGDMSCQTNEDCFGKVFLGSTSTSDKCQVYDEYADEQFYINRQVDPSATQCACDKSLSICKPRTLTESTGIILKPTELRSCGTDADCQGKIEKCTSTPGVTIKKCKEVDCTQASDCDGKFPRTTWSSGEILRNQPCDQNAEFPQKCFCSKSNWCSTRDGTEQCANADACGIGEICTAGKCVDAPKLNLMLNPKILQGVFPTTSGDGATDKQTQAKALYDELIVKLDNLEGRVEVLNTENGITGAFTVADLSNSNMLANIGSVAETNIPAADSSEGFTQDELANSGLFSDEPVQENLDSNLAEAMGNLAGTNIPSYVVPESTNWYKTIVIPAINGRMIALESDLCALAQLVDGLDYGGLVLYDGDEICSGLVEGVVARPYVGPRVENPTFLNNLWFSLFSKAPIQQMGGIQQ
jgi:hypothetical protein